uniref:Uncharacterized protein n=1 Tax=Eutreptiella gymnastica TaxID=73025 RepID=A0A7S1NJZ6_9EUGL
MVLCADVCVCVCVRVFACMWLRISIVACSGFSPTLASHPDHPKRTIEGLIATLQRRHAASGRQCMTNLLQLQLLWGSAERHHDQPFDWDLRQIVGHGMVLESFRLSELQSESP